MELERKLKSRRNYAVMNDRQFDTAVNEIEIIDQSVEPNESVVIFEAVISGNPRIIWRGYDFGSKPYYGFGESAPAAILDAISVMNRCIERPVVKPVSMVKQ